MRIHWPLLLLTGCLPEVAADLSLVDEPRILAVKAEPAEVTPGEPVTLTALYADASGQIAEAPLDWAFCTARRPLAELGPVNQLCLAPTGDLFLRDIGEGISVTASIPEDGCRLFGPDPPPAEPDQPSGRVVDPDLGGGYYQPIRILPPEGPESLTLLQLRIRCGLAGATQQQSAEYRQRYTPNLAPTLTLSSSDQPLDSIELRAGDELPLRATWASAETYLVFDPTTLTLITRREAISVAWFATGGSFEAARTGRAPDETETFSANIWTAPDIAGLHTLWVVLRDDRGAATWHSITVQVTP
jgi:hypothetical protein